MSKKAVFGIVRTQELSNNRGAGRNDGNRIAVPIVVMSDADVSKAPHRRTEPKSGRDPVRGS